MHLFHKVWEKTPKIYCNELSRLPPMWLSITENYNSLVWTWKNELNIIETLHFSKNIRQKCQNWGNWYPQSIFIKLRPSSQNWGRLVTLVTSNFAAIHGATVCLTRKARSHGFRSDGQKIECKYKNYLNILNYSNWNYKKIFLKFSWDSTTCMIMKFSYP